MEVPIGTIIAFAGEVTSKIKDHFLICDGSKMKKADFKDLSDAIGIAWGGTKDGPEFNLPDLRGMFLRGVNGDRNDLWKDPDANDPLQRVALTTGGNTGNKVGTVQKDALAPHLHEYIGVKGAQVYPQGAPNGIVPDPGQRTSENTGAGTRSETRPKNAYVFYLIRAK